MNLEQLKYPIGKPKIPKEINNQDIERWLETLDTFPSKLENLTKALTEEQLNTPYRPEGWKIKQVIHHCADSHHNSYTRFKWSLTENKPLIKAYYENRWAEIFDYSAPISHSILHLKAIHTKLVYLIRGMNEEQLNKSFIHPDGNEEVGLKENIGIYAWHCNHHYAHIEHLLLRKGWK